VKLLSEKNFNLDFEKSIQALQSYVANLDHLHLSFDMDVFLGDDLAVNLPHENGMSINMVMKILDEIKLPNSLSVDLVELNSSRGNFEQTKKLAQDVLLKILNKNSSSMGYNVDD
jgi:arginase family enzyme